MKISRKVLRVLLTFAKVIFGHHDILALATRVVDTKEQHLMIVSPLIKMTGAATFMKMLMTAQVPSFPRWLPWSSALSPKRSDQHGQDSAGNCHTAYARQNRYARLVVEGGGGID